jgi:very-short-patch-repair endonuclease
VGEEGKKVRLRDAQSCSFGVDALIAELASRQHGRVSRSQLVAAGVTDTQIAHRLETGQLLRLRRGVFAVAAHEGGIAGRLAAAVLTLGLDSAISHLSAAGRYEIRGDPVVIDVTCPRRLTKRDGIRVHHAPLEPDEIHFRDGLPLTSPSRTLFDLGTVLGTTGHVKAANEAFVKRLVTIEELHAARDRYAGRKGSTAFRRLLAELDPAGRDVRSPLETRLNAFLRARGFPAWESNAILVVGGETISPDVLWREQRVAVEADGRDPHLAPLTFDSDRRRDRRLRVEGWQPVRVTDRDLKHRPDELDADLRALLRLRQA